MDQRQVRFGRITKTRLSYDHEQLSNDMHWHDMKCTLDDKSLSLVNPLDHLHYFAWSRSNLLQVPRILTHVSMLELLAWGPWEWVLQGEAKPLIFSNSEKLKNELQNKLMWNKKVRILAADPNGHAVLRWNWQSTWITPKGRTDLRQKSFEVWGQAGAVCGHFLWVIDPKAGFNSSIEGWTICLMPLRFCEMLTQLFKDLGYQGMWVRRVLPQSPGNGSIESIRYWKFSGAFSCAPEETMIAFEAANSDHLDDHTVHLRMNLHCPRSTVPTDRSQPEYLL